MIDPIPLANLLGPLRPIESAAAARWRRGAEGEELTAELLAPIRYLGWVVLHDLRVPGSAANVDHLVIGPSRVWLIDSKARRGRIKVLGDGRLWYGRTCLDDSLAVVRWTAQSVGRVLTTRSASDAVVVQPVVCVHGARLPLSPLSWDGVVLVETGDLVELLTGTDSLFFPPRMQRLGATAASFLPLAGEDTV